MLLKINYIQEINISTNTLKACRGDKLDAGYQLEGAGLKDEPDALPRRIPVEADFLVASSSVEG